MAPHGSSALSTSTWKTELRRRRCCAPTCVISFWRISTPCTSFTARRVESGSRANISAGIAACWMSRRRVNGRELPLRNHAERALSDYFTSLNGHRPARLYDLVLREVEEPLFRVVLDYVHGNQSRAADILGINRGTLRKKLKQFGLAGS